MKNEKMNPRFFCVEVHGDDSAKEKDVSLRIPLNLMRLGIKLFSLMPKSLAQEVEKALKEKGFDYNLLALSAEDFKNFIDDLIQLEIDVDQKGNKVKVYCQ